MAPVVFWSDVACPWGTLGVWRWHQACARAGIPVEIDHRVFPLELLNGRCSPKQILDAEMPVTGALEPSFGYRLWTEPEWQWPVSSLPAMEAVQAAKEQSLKLSSALDLALRKAMFTDSRCITMRHVIEDVARGVDGLDADAVLAALDDGRARHRILEDLAVAETGRIKTSPHVFLPDGSDHVNPGVTFHWEGEPGAGGYPIVDSDDASVFDALVSSALAAGPS